MNQYTIDFHQAEFPGYVPSQSFEETVENFWYTRNIPFVDTGIDIDASKTYQWLIENDHLFKTNCSDYHRNQWFSTARCASWTRIAVSGDDYKTYNLQTQDPDITYYPDAVPDLVSELARVNLPVNRIKIFRLGAQGWADPHVDAPIPGSLVMNHIWLPLHDFPTSMKVYPYGYIKHRAGRIYLLNNNHYVHSVINTSDFPRYVALLKVDTQRLPTSTWEQIKANLKQQWFSDNPE
jgi:hypothetical protein